jgi:hypothetical protein
MSPTTKEVSVPQGATSLRPTVYCPSARVTGCLTLMRAAEEVR